MNDPASVMELADRAWLNDVGTGKLVTARDGSDALSLPPGILPAKAADGKVTTAHYPRRRKAD